MMDCNHATTSPKTFDFASERAASPSASKRSFGNDSFSELALLMRGKKPYDSKSKSNALPPLFPTPKGPVRPSSAIVTPSISSVELAVKVCPEESKHVISAAVSHNSNEHNVRSDRLHSANPPDMSPLLISDLEPPRNKAQADPPCPIESYCASQLVYRHEQELTTDLERLASQKMEKELDDMREHTLFLERRILILERNEEGLRDRASSLHRSLAEKEMLIQNQQAEINNLVRKLTDPETRQKEPGSSAAEGEHVHDTIKKLTRERDEALQASACAQQKAAQFSTVADIIKKHENNITDLRQKLVKKNLKIATLEDEIQFLKRFSNEKEQDELKAKLHEKTSECDRQRSQLRTVEAQLRDAKDRLARMARNNVSLQGAAYLVKPNAQTQLPKTVIACYECYANNMECDNCARCRSCIECDAVCTRWRCSIAHRFGDCPLTPCKLLHDSEGWLFLRTARPQW